MGEVIAFLKPIKEFIDVGFALMAKGTNKTPRNMAVSYQKLNAVEGVNPDVRVNYERVLVTRGNIPVAYTVNPRVEMTPDGLDFIWSNFRYLQWPHADDAVMLLAYFPALKRAVYLLSGAKRSQCAETLSIQPDLINKYMEIYISFVAQNRKKIANSIYMGNFNKFK